VGGACKGENGLVQQDFWRRETTNGGIYGVKLIKRKTEKQYHADFFSLFVIFSYWSPISFRLSPESDIIKKHQNHCWERFSLPA
jgi:hypothetical protein